MSYVTGLPPRLGRGHLERLVDALPLATVVFGSQAKVMTWNRAAEALFGWSADEVIGRQNPIVNEGERAGSEAIYARSLAGEHLHALAVQRQTRDERILLDELTRTRAFEPFYTTKPEGEGTGLGLSVVFGVIESLGGSVSIESSPGDGTTVEVLLPAGLGVADPAAPPRELPEASMGKGRVLLVEDREIVRELTSEVQRAVGFEVEPVASGREALQLAASAQPFDVVLTDVVMPEMSGPELAERLRSGHPALRVVYMSGYTDDVLDVSDLADPCTTFIRKPFQNADLVAAVRDSLGA